MITLMDRLRVWLLERLCEAEAVASAATDGPWEHLNVVGWETEGQPYASGWATGGGDEPYAHEVVTARDCPTLGVTITGPYGDAQSRADARFIAANDPARVLTRVRAQIAMLSPHRRVEPDVMRLMALEFADKPGYEPEWAPLWSGLQPVR